MRVAHLPERRRIYEIDVARHEAFEGLIGLAGGVFPHERHVIIHHSTYKWTLQRKGDNLSCRVCDRFLTELSRIGHRAL